MATPAQTSANSTGWSLKKLAAISGPTPSQSRRRVTPARAGFYHMKRPGAPLDGSGSGFVLLERPCELERRQRADELRMDAADVLVRLPQHVLLPLTQEGIATAAPDLLDDLHLPSNKTGRSGSSFPRTLSTL